MIFFLQFLFIFCSGYIIFYLFSQQLLTYDKRIIMKKITNFLKAFACITCFTVLINSVTAQPWPPFGMSGDGSEDDPYQITTITQLAQLATFVNAGNGPSTTNKYYKLMNDVAYTYSISAGWSPIGNNQTIGATFRGNFDGNGKKVYNIMINQVSTLYIGLFGYVFGANIHNLGIETCDIKGDMHVGGLVGRADNSSIENCYVNGSVTGYRYVGGLVGFITDSSIISNSYADGIVSGSRDIGGFIGSNYGTVHTSYSGGVVYDNDYQAGGFVGANYYQIVNCYATGNVAGTGTHIGGFAGASKEGIISYCYATGDVTGTTILTDHIGGFTGINSASLFNCVAANNTVTGGVSHVNRIAGSDIGKLFNNYAYEDMLVNGTTVFGGTHDNVNGENKPMATLESFNFYNTGSYWYNNIPWSIDTVDNPFESWKICDGETLPFLQWEGIDCAPLPPDTCYFYAYGGDGSQNNPYQIYYPCQLADLATFVNSGNGAQTLNKYFKLMNDIDLLAYSTGQGWEPIGGSGVSYTNFHFQGNFDGNRKVISNLKINRNTLGIVGLFGNISNATIHDLGIENCDITGCGNVGSLIGSALYSIVKNCYAIGNVTGIEYSIYWVHTGGLVGLNFDSSIDSCYTICNVIGAYMCGGLVGHIGLSAIINNCYATGTVTGTGAEIDNEIGGLAGFSAGIISNCYATGTVKGTVYASYIGGLVGAGGTSSGIISNCYATGTVKGTAYASFIGGLVGLCSGGIIRNCVVTNDTVAGVASNINRIVGINVYGGVLSNNYAYENMLVNGALVFGGTHNNVNGEDKSMSTLMSFNFYNTGSYWYNNSAWSIDIVQNPNKIWKICDTQTLPFFQWEGINCSKGGLPHSESDKEDYPAEQNGNHLLIIAPNPTSDIITVSTTGEMQQIEVFDITGRLIKSQTFASEQITFDTSIFPKGIYIVQARLKEGGVQRGKLVVK